jgi:hypothetical protein
MRSPLRSPALIGIRTPPLKLGPERITNGRFVDATGWAVTGSDGTHIATFDNGLRYQSDTTSPVLTVQQNGVFVIGRTYEIATVTRVRTSGSLKTDIIGTVILSSAVGVTRVRGVAAATFLSLTRNSANVDLILDFISVREVL